MIAREWVECATDQAVAAIALDLDVSRPVVYRALRDETLKQASA